MEKQFAVKGPPCTMLSLSRLSAESHVPLTEKDCNSCAAHDNILGNIREDERLPVAAYENG